LPAVASDKIQGTYELVDAAVVARRKGDGTRPGDKVGERLLQALPDDGSDRRWKFPRNLKYDPPEEGDSDSDPAVFPFTHESRYLAVIHADANGLGQLLISLINRASDLNAKGHAAAGQQYKELLPALSGAIENSMFSATVEAITAILLPAATSDTLPARPLVLAGDDLSILVRADLALPFMCRLLQAFEETSAQQIGLLAANNNFEDFANLLDDGLTACAGMVFVKNNHPFTHALHIAEDLCGVAKTEAKNPDRRGANAPNLPVASAIAFERLAESMQGQGTRKLPRVKAWGLGKHSQGLPQLDKLLEFVKVATTIAHGPLRRLLSTVEMSEAEAIEDSKRWRTIMLKTASGQLLLIDNAMRDMLPGRTRQDNFRIGAVNGPSVLPDLIDLLSVGLYAAPDAEQVTADGVPT
jgi:hypothetical protein